jgi:tetratricopeptide (TPR) repeat protein
MATMRRVCRSVLAGLTLLVAGPALAGDPSWRDLDQQAQTLLRAGKPAEALPVTERAVGEAEQALGPDHADVAACLRTRGRALAALRRFGDAAATYQRALAIAEKADGPETPLALPGALYDLALAEWRLERLDEAEAHLRRAAAIQERAGPQGEVALLDTLTSLGELRVNRGAEGGDPVALDDAERHLRRALELAERRGNAIQRGAALAALAQVLQQRGRSDEAAPLLRKALPLLEQSGSDSPALARVLILLASVEQSQRRPAEAERLLLRAIDVLEKVRGPDHPDVATPLWRLGMVRYFARRFDDAIPPLRRAVAIIEGSLGPRQRSLITPLSILGWAHLGKRQYAEAELVLSRVVDLAGPGGAPGLHLEMALTGLASIAAAYRQAGRAADAAALEARIGMEPQPTTGARRSGRPPPSPQGVV